MTLLGWMVLLAVAGLHGVVLLELLSRPVPRAAPLAPAWNRWVILLVCAVALPTSLYLLCVLLGLPFQRRSWVGTFCALLLLLVNAPRMRLPRWPVWLTAALFGRDIVSLASVQHPRAAFVTCGEPERPPSDAPADVTRDRGRAVLAGHG